MGAACGDCGGAGIEGRGETLRFGIENPTLAPPLQQQASQMQFEIGWCGVLRNSAKVADTAATAHGDGCPTVQRPSARL